MRKALLTLLAACFVLGGCTKSESVMSTTVAADPAIMYTTAEETKTEATSTQTEVYEKGRFISCQGNRSFKF